MNETGWIPRVVRIPILARRVRAMLEWRSTLVCCRGMYRSYGDTYSARFAITAPFGWVRRRHPTCHCVLVMPWWYWLLVERWRWRR